MKYILPSLISFLLVFPIFAQVSAQETSKDMVADILTQDESVVQAVRSEGENVWIKLAPAYLADSITVRISDKNQGAYRTWFNNEQDLVSVDGRSNAGWSDRVETKAKYIEYWHNNLLVLHLERK
jgi:hypothetical protein